MLRAKRERRPRGRDGVKLEAGKVRRDGPWTLTVHLHPARRAGTIIRFK